MSDKEIDTASKPELRVEEAGEVSNEAKGEAPLEAPALGEAPAIGEAPTLGETSNVEEPTGGFGQEEGETKQAEGLKSPAPVGVSKRTEEPDNSAEENEKAPPLPSRRRPIASPGEKSSVAFPKKKENPILKQLTEAFPNVEEKYVKAVIIASQGVVDPAFHALLFLSDPASGSDIELPTEPVQPPQQQQLPGEPLQRRQSQLEQDELLARQLDRKYNRRGGSNKGSSVEDWEREGRIQRLRERQRRMQTPMNQEEYRNTYGEDPDDDMWGQFMDRDLPELRERANKSIQDTATKLNGWLSGIKKNFYGEPENPPQRIGMDYREEYPKKPERRRFNSFGAQIGDESLESHGITLQNECDEEDVLPQLKDKKQSEKDVVAQTTYIDSPDQHAQRKKWQPVPPAPMTTSPTKQNGPKSPDEDEFLLNSEDEL
ncbi:related to Ubiquitin-binding protein CUE5 [Zygosaccharomyces bailii]|nr:related to Ubiquitin-binding protein CUE5 [Zygosaccharomyces bailii]